MDPLSRSTEEDTSHGNEMLLEDLAHIIQRPITNEAVRNKIKQAIGPYDDLLTTVKKRKLKWYGHVSRSSGLAKTILQGTVRGGETKR